MFAGSPQLAAPAREYEVIQDGIPVRSAPSNAAAFCGMLKKGHVIRGRTHAAAGTSWLELLDWVGEDRGLEDSRGRAWVLLCGWSSPFTSRRSLGELLRPMAEKTVVLQVLCDGRGNLGFTVEEVGGALQVATVDPRREDVRPLQVGDRITAVGGCTVAALEEFSKWTDGEATFEITVSPAPPAVSLPNLGPADVRLLGQLDEYRVVYRLVLVRKEPSLKAAVTKAHYQGASVRGRPCEVQGTLWLQLETLDSWMLVDGTALGIGQLLALAADAPEDACGATEQEVDLSVRSAASGEILQKLHLPASTTILDLKHRLAQAYGVAMFAQSLLLGLRVLDDDSTRLGTLSSPLELQLLRRAFDEDATMRLLEAAASGDLAAVAQELRSPADPNGAGGHDGAAPLHLAATHGHVDAIRCLVRAQAEVERGDRSGATPLHLASRGGHLQGVRHLLSIKADRSALTRERMTPLHMAAESGSWKVVKACVDAGAEINAASDRGITPIFLAARAGHATAVRILFEAKGDVKHRGEGGTTALHVAAQEGQAEVVEYLCDVGCDKDGRLGEMIETPRLGGATPLVVGACNGHKEVVRVLLHAGADKDVASSGGLTALSVAMEREHVEVVREMQWAMVETHCLESEWIAVESFFVRLAAKSHAKACAKAA